MHHAQKQIADPHTNQEKHRQEKIGKVALGNEMHRISFGSLWSLLNYLSMEETN